MQAAIANMMQEMRKKLQCALGPRKAHLAEYPIRRPLMMETLTYSGSVNEIATARDMRFE